MKIHNIITEGYYDDDPKADPKIVAKFADVSDSQRSYYIMKWAEEKGIDGDDAMFMAGYVQDGYMGAGAYRWRYVGLDEAKTNPMIMNRDGKEIELTKSGDSMSPSFHLKVDGQDHGTFDSEKKAMQYFAKLKEDDEEEEHQFFFVTVGTGRDSMVVKTRAKNRREAMKSQKMKYPDKTVRIKPEENPHLEEDDGVNDSGMIGEPDNYYDEEERKEAYDKMQDALDHADRHEHDYVMDGVCPNCAGSGYQDGEDEIWDEEEGEYVEGNECDGWGNFGCDEGQMMGASWREIMDHDYDREEREEIKSRPQPSDEILAGAMKQLHKNYVETGKINAFELPSLLRQMYPEISKGKAREIGGKFFKDFGTMNDPEPVTETSESESMVAKMLAKALGDESKSAEYSPYELFAELESIEPKKADMIALVAKMLYDVKLQERAYKDVGVADVVKDPRGKEFKFDKGSKQFKSVDGEKAAVSTKLGRELMRLRKNQMKKSTPSYNKKKFETVANEETYECDDAFFEDYGYLGYSIDESDMFEAEYRGRKVKLNKPMQGDVKKFKVYVKDPKTGNVKKVNFGHGGSSVKGKAMKIRKNNPKARKSFRARHNCDNPGPKTKARYWSCRKW